MNIPCGWDPIGFFPFFPTQLAKFDLDYHDEVQLVM